MSAAALAATISGAFAQEEHPTEGAETSAPRPEEAGGLIAFARDLRKTKGCAQAAPAYRVLAGMGEGQEGAQHELGECLLLMEGASEAETRLFRQEGAFWLTRAAYAGNARAQRKLAMEMASPAGALHNPKGSLEWSLIYGKNPSAELYGYGPLPGTLVPGLKSSLSETDIAEAEKFADEFVPITLPKFEGPEREEGSKRGEREKSERRRRGRR